jgi:hypothetical protein
LGDERSIEQWECRQYPSRTVNPELMLHKILLPLFWGNLTLSVTLGERNVKPQFADPFGVLVGQLGEHKIESWERRNFSPAIHPVPFVGLGQVYVISKGKLLVQIHPYELLEQIQSFVPTCRTSVMIHSLNLFSLEYRCTISDSIVPEGGITSGECQ